MMACADPLLLEHYTTRPNPHKGNTQLKHTSFNTRRASRFNQLLQIFMITAVTRLPVFHM
jgi:hypothetical protein